MATKLERILTERIVSGLRRTAVKTASKWAETYRIMPDGPWRFKRRPWLKGMHDSKAEMNIGEKSAQMGYTETLLNLTFYGIDMHGYSCLYVLPNKNPDASEFSAGRFGPALALSPHLQNLFTDADNVGHKCSGTASLYVRGSQSRSGLKGLPINFLFLDELAEFNQDNIELALARTNGQDYKKTWMISTPTVDECGISVYFNQSDKKHFFFECPSCKRMIELKFPESLVICGVDQFDPDVKKSHLICHQCKAVLPHLAKEQWLAKNQWIPTLPGRDWAGFTISQLYSPTISPVDLAICYFQSLTHQPAEIEFYNSRLGLPHIMKGARVTDEDLNYCITHGRSNRNSDGMEFHGNGLYTMGIDVGPRTIYYEIAKWSIDRTKFTGDPVNHCTPTIVRAGVIDGEDGFNVLDKLMGEFPIVSAVIDANPERRKAVEFAKKHYGRVKLCMFGSNIHGKTYVNSNVEYDKDPMIIVDRTTWLDQALGRFRNHTISLPVDTDISYKEMIKVPVKTYKKDHDGNHVSTYITPPGKADHYAFSRVYNEIAVMFAIGTGNNQDI